MYMYAHTHTHTHIHTSINADVNSEKEIPCERHSVDKVKEMYITVWGAQFCCSVTRNTNSQREAGDSQGLKSRCGWILERGFDLAIG